MMLRPLLAAFLATMGAIALSGCTQPLIVGSDLANRPFAYVDEHGEPRGIEVELVETIAEGLGRTVEWRRMEFEELLPACAAGEIDAVAATIGITPERERSVLFSQPYYRTRIALVTRTGRDAPRDHADLRELPVRASVGTTSERAVRTKLPAAKVIAVGKEAGSVAEALADGTIAAAAMDGPDATRLVASSNGGLVELAPLAEEHYAFAIAPQQAELRDAFDVALLALEADGTLTIVAERALEPRP